MAKVKLDLRQAGVTGLPVWGGRVYEEELAILQGQRGRQILREMSEQDALIGGILLGVEMLARQVPWTLKPATFPDKPKPPPKPMSAPKVDPTTGIVMPPEPPPPEPEDPDDKKAKEVADFIDECLSDTDPAWEDTLSEILSMIVYGWSYLEILYKRREGLNPDKPLKHSRFDDGKIGWRGWSIRSQDTLDKWEFSDGDTGDLTGMWQIAPPNYKPTLIPRSKSLHFKTRSRRQNPEGVSLLRNAYRAWYMKKNIEVIEGIGIERDLAGLPVLWADAELFAAEASADQKNLLEQLRNIVTAIKRDEQEGVLMPMAYDEEGKNPLYKLELLSSGGERQFDTNAIINRYDERIAMSMLADFILMGHQAVGSFALSTTKTGLFSTAMSAILDLIAAEINLHAIPTLVILNGWDLKYVPTLMHGNIETADLTKLGQFLKSLADAGMTIFPNEALEKYLLEASGMPGGDPGGAGQLPLPGFDGSGKPPFQLQPPTPQLPVASPTTQPALPAGRPVAKAKPAAKKPARKAANDRYTPLSQRVQRANGQLLELLEPLEYQEFLVAVFAAGKFSELPEEYQEVILKAESVD